MLRWYRSAHRVQQHTREIPWNFSPGSPEITSIREKTFLVSRVGGHATCLAPRESSDESGERDLPSVVNDGEIPRRYLRVVSPRCFDATITGRRNLARAGREIQLGQKSVDCLCEAASPCVRERARLQWRLLFGRRERRRQSIAIVISILKTHVFTSALRANIPEWCNSMRVRSYVHRVN